MRDPADRTRLAWTRTAIAFAALGAAMVKSSPVAGVVVLALSVPVWAAVHRLRHAAGTTAPRPELRLVTVMVVTVALGALLVAILGRGPASLDELLRGR